MRPHRNERQRERKARFAAPDGIRLVYLPPCIRELQRAKHLWPLLEEPVANRNFETLDALLADQFRSL